MGDIVVVLSVVEEDEIFSTVFNFFLVFFFVYAGEMVVCDIKIDSDTEEGHCQ